MGVFQFYKSTREVLGDKACNLEKGKDKKKLSGKDI